LKKREREKVSGRNTEGTRNMWGCKSTEKESEKCYVYKKGDKHDREKCYLQKWYMDTIPLK
jgi:hypothetical protein